MSEWLVLCSDTEFDRMRGVVANMDESPLVYWTDSQNELRERVAASRPGELGVLVGVVGAGVSDINLAAAVVADDQEPALLPAGEDGDFDLAGLLFQPVAACDECQRIVVVEL